MYQFTDTKKSTQGAKTYLSEVLILNNQKLDDLVPQVKTLNVKGRGLVDRDISKTKYSGQDGESIDFITDRSKKLEVEILVTTKNSKELETTLNKLDSILRAKSPLLLSFGDDIEYYYSGEFESSTQPPKGELVFIMYLSFFLPKPYKYKKVLDTYSGKSSVLISKDYKKKTIPEEITIKGLNSTIQKFTLTCGTKKISIITNKDVTGELILRPIENTLVQSATDRSWMIAWESDLESFYVDGKPTIKCDQPNLSLTINIREVI